MDANEIAYRERQAYYESLEEQQVSGIANAARELAQAICNDLSLSVDVRRASAALIRALDEPKKP